MNFNTFWTIFNNLKDNEVVYVKYEGNLAKKMRASASREHTLTKTTETLLVKGIEYAKQLTVIDDIANGYQLTHKLPWGEWDSVMKNIINHKGNRYARFYYVDGQRMADGTLKGLKGRKDVLNITKYFLDGKEVSYQFLKENDLMQNSFFNEKEVNALTINVDNILEIGW